MVEEIIFKVARRRVKEIASELPHPDIATHFSIDDEGRGQIDLFFRGDLIGQEFIETSDSWKKKDRLFDYRRVLAKKIRLVVMAPRADAMRVRMMMLELNNWWMFYYMVYGYDERGRLFRIIRPAPPHEKASYTSYIS